MSDSISTSTVPVPPKPITMRCPHCHNPIVLSDRPGDEVLCPGCGSTFRVRDARLTDTVSQSRPLGKFQLLERVGQGAFGAVWKARDTVLDRVIALKIPHSGLLTEAEELERFHREARAAAQLRHPGIVTVHEVLALDGLPAIVADFVQGVTLKDYLEVRKLPFPEAAALIADLAEALNYAHQMGLVHRDIKPSNIMLEQGTNTRPMLMDFGLALREEAEVTLTLDGQLIGTPAYMSPEQAAGKGHQADRRSDVYSLGVVLYELLTGELPFRGSKAMMLYQVLQEEPRPPRAVNDKIPRDLETICLKCLHKDAARRYQTAREMADDLRRFLAGEPILARPIGALERAMRWVRRKPAAAALLVGSALTTIVVLVAGGWFTARLQEERTRFANKQVELEQQEEIAEQMRGLRQAAEEQGENARRYLYTATMNLAQRAWTEGQMPRLRELLSSQQPDSRGVQEDLRHFEWYYLWRLYHSAEHTLTGHTGEVTSVVYSPDGKLLASASRDATIRLWNASTGKHLTTLRSDLADVNGIAFSSDGKWLASACNDAVIRIWDVASARLLRAIEGHENEVTSVSFSPDGKWLASASHDATIRIWDTATWREPRILRSHEIHPVFAVAFSPDGKLLASVGLLDVKVQDFHTEQVVLSEMSDRGSTANLVFSPDGENLFAAGKKHNIPTTTPRKKIPQRQRVEDLQITAAACSPDGRQLAQGLVTNEIQIVDSGSGAVLRTYRGHGERLRTLAYSPDGLRLAAAGADQVVKIWDVTADQNGPIYQGHDERVLGLAFSPDGRRLATGAYDWNVKVWDLIGTKAPLTIPAHKAAVTDVAFSPDGRHVASSSIDGTVKIWDSVSGKLIRSLEGHTGLVHSIAYSVDGRRIASGGDDRTVRVWDASTGKTLVTITGHEGAIQRVVCAGNNRLLASASSDMTVKVWDLTTGSARFTLTGHTGWISSLAFSSDSCSLASGSYDLTIQIWDLKAGTSPRKVFTLKGHKEPVLGLAFSPDGKRLASAGGQAKLWDTASGQEVFSTSEGTTNVAFAPVGRRVAWSKGMTALVWDADGLTQQEQATRRQFFDNQRQQLYLKEVTRAEQSRQWRIARWNLERLINVRPDDWTIRERLARVDSELRDWQKVAAHYTKAIARKEDDATAWHGRARAQANQGQWKQARSDCEKAIALSPEDAAIRFTLGRIHFGLGQWENADNDFKHLLNKTPRALEVLLFSYLVQMRLGRTEEAEALIARVMDETDLVRFPVGRAWGQKSAGTLTPANWYRLQELRDDLTRLLDGGNDESWLRRARGLAYAAMGQWGQAALDFAAATRAEPNDWRGRLGLARARAESFQWKEAVSACSKVLADKSTTADVWYLRGICEAAQNHHKEASSDFARALELGADGWGLRLARGEQYNRLREWDRAIVESSRAIAFDGKQFQPYHLRGFAHQQRGDHLRAIADFGKALQISSIPSVHGMRGDSYFQTGRWNEARADYTRAIRGPVGAEVTYLYRPKRALLLASLGYWEEASLDFRIATYAANPSPRVWADHSLVLVALGDWKAYRGACQKLVKSFVRQSPDLVAWTCVVGPEAVSNWSPILQLADVAVKTPDSRLSPTVIGAIFYRAGQTQPAINHLKQAVAAHGKGGTEIDWLFLTMAHHRAGNSAEAHKCLVRALAEKSSESKTVDPDRWRHQLAVRVLRHEAQTLLKTTKPGEKLAQATLSPAISLPKIELPGKVWGGAIRTDPAFNANALAPGDDSMSSPVHLGFAINFLGLKRMALFINNNGNVSFDAPHSQFTPKLITGSRGIAVVAPFFADVDTRGRGSEVVRWGRGTLNGRKALGVNWVGVGYFSEHTDKVNSFQLVLIDRSDTGPGNFDMEFNYGAIHWETGDASGGIGGKGGVSARVGFGNGTGAAGTSFELLGSGVSGSFLDDGPRALVRNRLNSDVPGRYVFEARNGSIRVGFGR